MLQNLRLNRHDSKQNLLDINHKKVYGHGMYNPKINKTAQRFVSRVVKDIMRLPGGYMFWHGLPSKGKQSRVALQKRWRNAALQALQSTEMQFAMLHACLSPDGTVDQRGLFLYRWMVEQYFGKPYRLFDTWSSQHMPSSPYEAEPTLANSKAI